MKLLLQVQVLAVSPMMIVWITWILMNVLSLADHSPVREHHAEVALVTHLQMMNALQQQWLL
jgi:hypothetical protein